MEYILIFTVCLSILFLLNAIRHFRKKGEFKVENKQDQYTLGLVVTAFLMTLFIIVKLRIL